MPGKRPSVRNEKQYEKLTEKGMSKEQREAGRDDRPEEAAGRKGGRATTRKS